MCVTLPVHVCADPRCSDVEREGVGTVTEGTVSLVT